MWALVALLWTQSADVASVQLCVPNDQSQIETEIGFVRADGRVWWSPPGAPDAERRLFESSAYRTARDRPWLNARDPLIIGDKTFVYVGPHQVTVAFNRYHRDHPSVDGITAVTPLGREHNTVLLLTDPIGCWFAEYRLE